jgi:uncharacterized heparinase superfamily protein
MAYKALERRLKFLIASARRHGLSHVVEVFRNDRVRKRYALAPIPVPTTEEFRASFGYSERSPEAFLERFDVDAARRLPLTRKHRKEFLVNLLVTIERYDDILTDAEMIADGRFPALGISTLEPDGTLDWHRDYSSGRIWPPLPYNRIRFMDAAGGDVKYVWEMSRFYWVGWLAKAFWGTSNGAWVRDFVRLVDDWRAKNPVNVGVNWAMPMEIAIRGYWLMAGYGFFSGAPGIGADWWIEYLRLAWAHASHLENNLEYFSNLTNHYLSNCFGLLSLGLLLQPSPDGARWFIEGRRRMIEELEHQVLDDGVHYERSIGYHGLVLEIYLAAIVLAERGGHPFPPEALRKIERMAEFTLDYMPPTGGAPQLGDCDDGRIFRLRHDQDLYDHRDLLALAATLFARGDMAAAAGGYSLTALFSLGAEGFERFRALAPQQRKRAAIYRDGGFARMSSSGLHLFADIGPIGLHGNNDTLSFTLDGRQGPFIVDPGTYCYTRSERLRNELRSTRAHDTPTVDDGEIAEFDGLWRIKTDRTAPALLEWSEGSDANAAMVLEASHGAYRQSSSGGVVVSRRWELDEERLSIRDRFEGVGSHEVAIRFTIPSECIVTPIDAAACTICRPDGETLELRCSHPLRIERGWYSPSYGVAESATRVELSPLRVTVPAEITYICRLLS